MLSVQVLELTHRPAEVPLQFPSTWERDQDLFLILWPWPDSSLALLEESQLSSGSTGHHWCPLV